MDGIDPRDLEELYDRISEFGEVEESKIRGKLIEDKAGKIVRKETNGIRKIASYFTERLNEEYLQEKEDEIKKVDTYERYEGVEVEKKYPEETRRAINERLTEKQDELEEDVIIGIRDANSVEEIVDIIRGVPSKYKKASFREEAKFRVNDLKRRGIIPEEEELPSRI